MTDRRGRISRFIAVCVFGVCLYDAKLRLILVGWGGFFLCVARFFLFACLAQPAEEVLVYLVDAVGSLAYLVVDVADGAL